MIVYGDHPVPTTLAQLHTIAVAHLEEARATPSGLARHVALVAAFLAQAEITRALADALFAEDREDRPHPQVDAQMAMLVRLARAVAVSWRSSFRRTPVPRSGFAPPDRAVATKPAEGFAFYALYPEAVLEAAARTAPGRDTIVVGLRGIGVAVATLAAAALRSCCPTITLRPTGPPFAREIAASPALAATVVDAPRALVVDEGPGLSGSSLAAAARWLGNAGVPGVTLLTSHPNPPGGEASPETRAIWDACARVSADFDATILPQLPGWVAALAGEPIIGWEDLCAGAWALPHPAPPRFASPSLAGGGQREAQGKGARLTPPPTDPARERRKYRATTATTRTLVKFAGLGDIGQAKLARARALAAQQLTTEPIGLAHGFLVERWIDAGAPTPPTQAEITRYLEARIRLSPPNTGATLADLIAMARANIAEALGEPAAAAFVIRAAGADRLASRTVATDNRLHAWEWLRDAQGHLFKTDALDHCEAHDLIGCQDIAWDIAGAGVELGADTAALTTALGADPALVALHGLLYPAFQLGLWTMADHPRADVYAAHLNALLSVEPPRAAADR